jgi:hypothetical protein
MSAALLSILTDPWFYLLLIALLWGTRLALQRWIHGAVDHRFALRVESHKHQLQLIIEEERFDLQRRLAGASLYLQKQHAAAAEIYSAVRVAHGSVSSLFGIQRGFDLDDFNEEDLREILTSSEVLKGKQDELLRQWQGNRIAGAKAIKQYLFELGLPRAERRLQEASNAMYLNEIYFSDETITALDAFVGECNLWISRRQFPPQRGERVEPVSHEKLNKTLEDVQTALRAELSNSSRQRTLTVAPKHDMASEIAKQTQ